METPGCRGSSSRRVSCQEQRWVTSWLRKEQLASGLHWTRDLLQQNDLTEDVNLQDKEEKVLLVGRNLNGIIDFPLCVEGEMVRIVDLYQFTERG